MRGIVSISTHLRAVIRAAGTAAVRPVDEDVELRVHLVFPLQHLLEVAAHEGRVRLRAVAAGVGRDEAVRDVEEDVAQRVGTVLLADVGGQVERTQVVENDARGIRRGGRDS